MPNNPTDTKHLLLLWLFCVANYSLLQTITEPANPGANPPVPPFDFTNIANATGLTVDAAKGLISFAALNNNGALDGATPLEQTASLFSRFATRAGYVPEGGKVCGTVDEIIAAIEA